MVQRCGITRRGAFAGFVGGLFAADIRGQSQAEARERMLGFWREIRRRLTNAAESADYWRTLYSALIPGGFSGIRKFTGKLVAASPETNPTELMIAVDGAAADVKLEMIEALTGRMPAGSEISFEGVPMEFTRTPYLLTLECDTVDIEGWLGK